MTSLFNIVVRPSPVIVETTHTSSTDNAIGAESNIQTTNISKVNISEVALDKVNIIQVPVNPDSVSEITSSKPTTAWSQGAVIIDGDTKVTSSKINIIPTDKLQIRFSQIGIADSSSVHFDVTKKTPFQINSTEVASTEIATSRIANPDIWKLSLPSGITSQQFLNTELLSQNSNPQVFNIESTAEITYTL